MQPVGMILKNILKGIDKMKKILKIVILVISISFVYSVKAANYSVKELIPVDKETTIISTHFSYKGIYFNSNKESDNKYSLIIPSIRNNFEDEKPYGISVALFDREKKNIGTINYCEGMIAGKEEKPSLILKAESYLGKGYSGRDVQFIAVLGENETCRQEGASDYIGQSLEEIGIAKNTTVDDDAKLTVNVYLVVGGLLLFLFLMTFLFTNRYKNVDGDDVRNGYKKYNKQLKEEREYNNRVNPPPVVEPPKEKSDEVLAQEQNAANEDKSGTDLHNLYK